VGGLYAVRETIAFSLMRLAAFITGPEIPHSSMIDERLRSRLPSPKECWFTGTRVHGRAEERLRSRPDGWKLEMWKLWNRRQFSKFGGCHHRSTRGPRLPSQDRAQIKALVSFYMENARLFETVTAASCVGECAPSLVKKTPNSLVGFLR